MFVRCSGKLVSVALKSVEKLLMVFVSSRTVARRSIREHKVD